MPQLSEERCHSVAPLVKVFYAATDAQRPCSILLAGYRTNRRAALFPMVELIRDQARTA